MIPLRGGRGEIEVPTSYLFKLARTDGEEKEEGRREGEKREREKSENYVLLKKRKKI